jgi:hypothetical protein
MGDGKTHRQRSVEALKNGLFTRDHRYRYRQQY